MGTLTFAHGWVALTISGPVTPAVENENLPEGIVATGEGLSAVYNIQGFFIDDDHIVGTVVGVRNDLGDSRTARADPLRGSGSVLNGLTYSATPLFAVICIMLILDPRSTALVLIDLQNGIIGTVRATIRPRCFGHRYRLRQAVPRRRRACCACPLRLGG